jgi:hypothetical protein
MKHTIPLVAVTAILLPAGAGAQGCPSSNQVPSCTMKPAIAMAGIGALLDALHKGRTIVTLTRVEHR